MSDRTEEPTPRKLEEARKEGQTVKSIELNTAAALMVGSWLINGPGRQISTDLQGLLSNALTNLPKNVVDGEVWVRQLLFSDVIRVGYDLLIFLFGMALTGIVVTVSQTGPMFAQKQIGFDFNKVNPLTGFKRMFSGQGVMEFLKALIKLLVVGYVAYDYLMNRSTQLIMLVQMPFLSGIATWLQFASEMITRVAGVYLIAAFADYFYQRQTFMKSMKMSKEEIKEESRKTEGDPLIKGRIRNQQRRFARMRMMSNVQKADVVITNPTHLALAIQYDQATMLAPKVLAKGADFVALQIKKIAAEHNVPVIENKPLARGLYNVVEIDQEIPAEFYVAIAEILAYVYQTKGKNQ